ncbi:MAG TPA: c-type cytochrome biogenesis protein CcmI [Candidatus Aquabacterium excrementipullorum]|nr:c-type cytochrome biogenesis protein CcmI [Candidatus Aquabacterium excrementipullorum]
MSGFWLSATGLLTLALLFVLPPLLRTRVSSAGRSPQVDDLNLDVLRAQQGELDADLRSGALPQQAYEAARQDLVRRVVEDVRETPAHAALAGPARQPWTAAAVALVVGAIAVGLYQVAGTPAALDAANRLAPAPAAQPGAPSAPFAAGPDGTMTAEQVQGMVDRLAKRLADKPDDPEGWRMLIRSYETLRRFGDAAAAYAKLLKLVPETPELLADYAVVLGMTQGETLIGEPEKLIQRALALDPDNLQALALAGSAAFERKDYANAVKPWQRLLTQVPPDSEMARSIGASIDKARALQDGKATLDRGKE